jgi:hypothetical protein
MLWSQETPLLVNGSVQRSNEHKTIDVVFSIDRALLVALQRSKNFPLKQA